MSYERDENARLQEATESVIRMRQLVPNNKKSALELRVERLERIVEHLCPDKSDDV